MSFYNVSIEALKWNSFSLFPNRSKANPIQRTLDCILCSALIPSGMYCHLLQESLMLILYLFWDRRTGRVLHSPGNDHLENLDDLHRGTPRWDRNGSRHWCRDVLPACDHRSGIYSLQGKNQPEKSSHEPSWQLQAFCSFPRNYEWRNTLTAVITFPLITFCRAFLCLQAQVPLQEKFGRKLEVYLSLRLSPLEERDHRAVMFLSISHQSGHQSSSLWGGAAALIPTCTEISAMGNEVT